MYVDRIIALYNALAGSRLHQPGPPQGSGPDWLLSSPARDKRASLPGSVVVVVVVVVVGGVVVGVVVDVVGGVVVGVLLLVLLLLSCCC